MRCDIKIVYYTRSNYIANETLRLDPDNKTPAREILAEDLKHERDMEKAENDLLHTNMIDAFSSIVVSVIAIAGVIVATFLIYSAINEKIFF